MDRRLQARLAEVASESRRRRITGVLLVFSLFMLTACANEIGVHFRFGIAALCSFLILVATWLWGRRCWERRYRVAAHICIAVEITTLWVLFILLAGYQHEVSIAYLGFIAGAALLLLGKRAAITWALVTVVVYSLRFFSPDAASRTFGPTPMSLVAAALFLAAAVAAVWVIDRQYRAAAEFAVVSDFERNSAVRLSFQYSLAETGRKTATLGHEIKPMLVELADIAERACQFVGRLASSENVSEPTDFIEDLKMAWEAIRRHSVRACSVAQTMTHSSIGRQLPSAAGELVDISSLILEQTQILATALVMEGAARVEISTNVESLGSTLVAGGYSPLAEMLQNLITNAVDSVREKARRCDGAFQGRVQITGRLLGSEVEIRVTDNGVGLEASKVDAYFEPFFTTKPPTSGRAGLGLVTSRSTLVELGGDLTLEAEPRSGGAVATAILPVAVSASDSVAPQPAESLQPVANSSSPPKSPALQIAESAAQDDYRLDRYRATTVLALLAITITGVGFADRQRVWIMVLAALTFISIASWTWFEGNSHARFNIASRIVTYSVGVGAIVMAATRGTIAVPLKDMLSDNFPPLVMLLMAIAVGYGFAGARLALTVGVPAAIFGFAGVVLVEPFDLEPIALKPSLLAAGAVMEIAGLVTVMLLPHTFSLALQNARRSRALLQESREARFALSQVETEAALGRVSSGVLHEVANPLNFIQNFAVAVLDSFSDYSIDPADYRSEYDLFQMAEKTQRLSIDINDRLDALRLSANSAAQPAVDRTTAPVALLVDSLADAAFR